MYLVRTACILFGQHNDVSRCRDGLARTSDVCGKDLLIRGVPEKGVAPTCHYVRSPDGIFMTAGEIILPYDSLFSLWTSKSICLSNLPRWVGTGGDLCELDDKSGAAPRMSASMCA